MQKLRDLQERESDRQTEQDELRAKRAWEDNERKIRIKEAEDVKKKQAVIKEIEKARVAFEDEKSRKQA